MSKILVDFHHSSLLRSLVLLFEGRLGLDVYRPIGLEWFPDFWRINDNPETAAQYLSPDQAFEPSDGTPTLNTLASEYPIKSSNKGAFYVLDPGNQSMHMACTLEYFKNNRFDYVVASIPAHVPLFKKLIKLYQPHAKLIVQVGNGWDLSQFDGLNVLASVAPQYEPPNINLITYHQEFDTDIFYPTPVEPTGRIHSFINILQNMPRAWTDFLWLERLTESAGLECRSFGGQCRDGNLTGPHELANAMREAMMVFHVKDGGDGFGHIIHNAYAVGRPVITRRQDYIDTMAEDLLVSGTYIDLDLLSSHKEAAEAIIRLHRDPHRLEQMGRRAAERFNEVVNYEKEAEEIGAWMQHLK